MLAGSPDAGRRLSCALHVPAEAHLQQWQTACVQNARLDLTASGAQVLMVPHNRRVHSFGRRSVRQQLDPGVLVQQGWQAAAEGLAAGRREQRAPAEACAAAAPGSGPGAALLGGAALLAPLQSSNQCLCKNR